jgi:hypothetical protein
LDEAGLLDAVAFVTGGQEEGAIPQGFETRWRRTVRERKIEYQSIGPNAGFGQVIKSEEGGLGHGGVWVVHPSRSPILPRSRETCAAAKIEKDNKL